MTTKDSKDVPAPKWRSFGLLGRILFILIAVMATEFVTNTYLFDRASQFALHEDEVERLAEHLVVARRLMDKTSLEDRAVLARALKTDRFSVSWSAKAIPVARSYELDNLRGQIIGEEPALAAAGLNLRLRTLPKGGEIEGTLALNDGSYMSFHTGQGKGGWPLTYSRIIGMIAPTLVLVILGVLLIRYTLRPLTVLIHETSKVGTVERQPVPEEGPAEIRNLIHAFNVMQLRIHRLINSRTQALAAVGHDLRTPLARMRLRLDGASVDDRIREAMERDMDEMNDLLRSLQVYLSGDGRTMVPERIDLAAMVMTLVDDACDAGNDADYSGPDNLEMVVRPVAIRRALANLIDNALHYGGNARVFIRRLPILEADKKEQVEIVIEDDGPGIDESQLEEVLQPFVRLDGARGRNTRGMGLGLAIVADAVAMEQGSLSLANRSEGGLRVVIRLPLSPDATGGNEGAAVKGS